MSKYDYDPQSNRRDKIIGIALAIVGVTLLAVGIAFIVKLIYMEAASTLILVGFALTVIGPGQVSKARKRRKTATKFVKCLECSAINANGSKICKKCGKPIRTFCPHCAAELHEGDYFCKECGRAPQFEDLPDNPMQSPDEKL